MISNSMFNSSHSSVRFNGGDSPGRLSRKGSPKHLPIPDRTGSFGDPIESGAASPTTPGTPNLMEKLSLLFAEDNPINRKIFEANVKKYNKGKPQHLQFDYTIATNGREAFEAFKRKRPDAAVLDHEMPEMTGIQATREIKRYSAEHTPNEEVPPIFMYSASGNMAASGAGGEKAAKEAGVDEYHDKTTNLQDLLEAAAKKAHAHRRRTSVSSSRMGDSISSLKGLGLGIKTGSPEESPEKEKGNPFSSKRHSRTPSFDWEVTDHSNPESPVVLSRSQTLSRSGTFSKPTKGIPEEEEHHDY